MNIQKATTAAVAIDGFLFREAWRRHIRLEPSDSDEGFFVHSKYSKAPRPRWQPKAEDLMADDWEVSADLGGLVEITIEEST